MSGHTYGCYFTYRELKQLELYTRRMARGCKSAREKLKEGIKVFTDKPSLLSEEDKAFGRKKKKAKRSNGDEWVTK